METRYTSSPTDADVAVKVHAGAYDPVTRQGVSTDMANYVMDHVAPPPGVHDVGPTMIAHEIGHVLGLPDEYVDSRFVMRETDTAPGSRLDGSIMGNFHTENRDLAELKARHLDQLSADIDNADRAGRTTAKMQAVTP